MAVTAVARVKGFEGYWVTSEGEILSAWRPHGIGPYRIRNDMPMRTLKPRRHSAGYLRVSLGSGNDLYIHRIVAEAFIGEVPSGHHVRHLDGDRTNNRLVNLAIGTAKENHQDKLRHGRHVVGSAHKNARLTESLVRQARTLWRGGMRLDDVVTLLGEPATRSTVHNAIIGKTWAHVAGIPEPRNGIKGEK